QESSVIASPSATLTNVTVAGNTGGIDTAGISTEGSVVLRNSIVANNTRNTTVANCAGGSGMFTSQGFNLVFPETGCGFPQPTDKQSQDPKLGPLQDNGGGMPTMALGIGSPAIDAGNNTVTPGSGGAACAATDQRGLARTDGNNDGAPRCDVGAFEAVP